MKTFIITAAVTVPAYATVVVKAKSKKEAEAAVLAAHDTGAPTTRDSFWESKLWQNHDFKVQWAEANRPRILDVELVKGKAIR